MVLSNFLWAFFQYSLYINGDPSATTSSIGLFGKDRIVSGQISLQTERLGVLLLFGTVFSLKLLHPNTEFIH